MLIYINNKIEGNLLEMIGFEHLLESFFSSQSYKKTAAQAAANSEETKANEEVLNQEEAPVGEETVGEETIAVEGVTAEE